MWYILDENGEPKKAETLEAAMWFESKKNDPKRVVALTELPDDVSLSTVFLCLDHGMGRFDEPMIYESMWFGGIHDGRQRRYSTKQEAKEGHAEMLLEYAQESGEDVEDFLRELEGV